MFISRIYIKGNKMLDISNDNRIYLLGYLENVNNVIDKSILARYLNDIFIAIAALINKKIELDISYIRKTYFSKEMYNSVDMSYTMILIDKYIRYLYDNNVITSMADHFYVGTLLTSGFHLIVYDISLAEQYKLSNDEVLSKLNNGVPIRCIQCLLYKTKLLTWHTGTGDLLTWVYKCDSCGKITTIESKAIKDGDADSKELTVDNVKGGIYFKK